MYAHIEHGASCGEFGVVEPCIFCPAGVGASVCEPDPDHEGFSDGFILQEFFGFLGAGEHSVCEADHEFFACFFGRGDHFVCVFEGGGYWFFAEYVASCVEGCDGVLGVEDVGCADADDVEVFVFEHVFVVGVGGDFSEPLFDFFVAFRGGFCEGDDFGASVFFVSGEVAFLCDGSCADDADFVGFFGGGHVCCGSWGVWVGLG